MKANRGNIKLAPSTLMESLLAGGSVTDPEVARSLADELLEAHRAYLPNFFPEE